MSERLTDDHVPEHDYKRCVSWPLHMRRMSWTFCTVTPSCNPYTCVLANSLNGQYSQTMLTRNFVSDNDAEDEASIVGKSESAS